MPQECPEVALADRVLLINQRAYGLPDEERHRILREYVTSDNPAVARRAVQGLDKDGAEVDAATLQAVVDRWDRELAARLVREEQGVKPDFYALDIYIVREGTFALLNQTMRGRRGADVTWLERMAFHHDKMVSGTALDALEADPDYVPAKDTAARFSGGGASWSGSQEMTAQALIDRRDANEEDRQALRVGILAKGHGAYSEQERIQLLNAALGSASPKVLGSALYGLAVRDAPMSPAQALSSMRLLAAQSLEREGGDGEASLRALAWAIKCLAPLQRRGALQVPSRELEELVKIEHARVRRNIIHVLALIPDYSPPEGVRAAIRASPDLRDTPDGRTLLSR